VKPGRDEKVLTAWNALALKAFAEAGAAFENPRYLDISRRNAEFLLSALVRDGRLLRTWKADGRGGGAARLKGYLEDYAFLIDALTSLYEATFEQRWLHEAVHLAGSMIDLFWDADQAVFYDTGRDHEQLVVRPRDIFDNATPCGGSAAALALLRLAKLTGDPQFERHAVSSIGSVRGFLTRAPAGFGHWLAALDFNLSKTREVAVIGLRNDARTAALVRTIWGTYQPNRVLAGSETGVADDDPRPLLAGRGMVEGKPAAYVCEDYVCRLPVTSPQELVAQLSAG
jgi:uncharacterized protein YyaL (SSP411 family)